MANQVLYGVNTLSASLEGRTVSAVRAMLSQALNIPADAQATVGGQAVAEDYILCDGDEVEFVKASGTKGA